MAKGIVLSRPGSGGGTAGRVMASENSTDSSGKPINAGTVFSFKEDIKANDGDLVDFQALDGSAQDITLLKPGRIITGPSSGITVSTGECVLISAANIQGKVAVEGGTLAITNKTSIIGKVESSTADSSLLFDSNCTVEGRLEFTGASYLSVKDATIDGRLVSNGNAYASVIGCTIKGKLEVVNAKICNTYGNTVEGPVDTPGCK